jgi:hypothetical protein
MDLGAKNSGLPSAFDDAAVEVQELSSYASGRTEVKTGNHHVKVYSNSGCL